MRYKIGQKVLVIKDLSWRKSYFMEGGRYRNSVSLSMERYRGKIMTIDGFVKGDRGYTLKEDGDRWTWTDEMLEVSNEMTLALMNKKKQEKKESERGALDDYLLFDIGRISDGFSQMPRFTIPRAVPRFSIPQSSRDYVSRWFER